MKGWLHSVVCKTTNWLLAIKSKQIDWSTTVTIVWHSNTYMLVAINWLILVKASTQEYLRHQKFLTGLRWSTGSWRSCEIFQLFICQGFNLGAWNVLRSTEFRKFHYTCLAVICFFMDVNIASFFRTLALWGWSTVWLRNVKYNKNMAFSWNDVIKTVFVTLKWLLNLWKCH